MRGFVNAFGKVSRLERERIPLLRSNVVGVMALRMTDATMLLVTARVVPSKVRFV